MSAGQAIGGGGAARAAGGVLFALLATLAALNLVFALRHIDDLRPVSSGQLAPAFALPRLGGGELRFPDPTPAGVTVLDFWATWCPPCRAELPVLDRFARAHSEVRVIAVDTEDADAREAVAALTTGAGLTIPVALAGRAVAERYHVESLPHVVVIDRTGVVRRVFIGAADEDDLARAAAAAARP